MSFPVQSLGFLFLKGGMCEKEILTWPFEGQTLPFGGNLNLKKRRKEIG